MEGTERKGSQKYSVTENGKAKILPRNPKDRRPKLCGELHGEQFDDILRRRKHRMNLVRALGPGTFAGAVLFWLAAAQLGAQSAGNSAQSEADAKSNRTQDLM